MVCRRDRRREIHTRGAHYIALGTPKFTGEKYAGDDWLWISKACRAARWLGYIPFDQITDERNNAPILRIRDELAPTPMIAVDEVELDLTPHIWLSGWQAMPLQPFRIALFGEKTSLFPVLNPLSERYGTDLLLPTGEASDTMIWSLAQAADEDGRPLRVLYFSDCDPSGHQMAISVAWKLRALRALLFPDLEFELYPVALTVEQVLDAEDSGFRLPSSPLSKDEKRADNWQSAHGIEQVEIDALATLHPEILSEVATEGPQAVRVMTCVGCLYCRRHMFQGAA